jgi:hypothetical protein
VYFKEVAVGQVQWFKAVLLAMGEVECRRIQVAGQLKGKSL